MTWRLEIHHIDVSQGDSTLILVKSDQQIAKSVLIDGGPSNYGLYVADYVSQRCSSKDLDIMVLSHDHADHKDGLNSLFSQNTCRCQDADRYAPRALKIGGYQFKACNVSQELLQLSPPGITMTCIAANSNNRNENLNSLAFLVKFSNFRYYTGGDLEGSVEDQVAQSLKKELHPVHAFKAGHHGSRVSASKDFLSVLKPTAAIISCGYDDSKRRDWWKYGHPSQEIIDRLQENTEIQNYYLTSCSLKSSNINPNPTEPQTEKARVSGYADPEKPQTFEPGNIILTIDLKQAGPSDPRFSVTYTDAIRQKRQKTDSGVKPRFGPVTIQH